jgi:demethoxyubiquinone hydroxylase (CLK1/Coq7/Cat5 family)
MIKWAVLINIIVVLRFRLDIFVSPHYDSGLLRMNKRSRRLATDKVIHIRIDEETHRKLKMHAASSKATIQQLVEGLISKKYDNMQVRNAKP